MSATASQITGVSIVCSAVCLEDQRKHQSPASQKVGNAENVSISWPWTVNKCLFLSTLCEITDDFIAMPQACTPTGFVCGSMVSTVRSWALELVRIGTFRQDTIEMTWCSSQTPSSRHGRLTWEVEGSVSTWRRPSVGLMLSRNLASTLCCLHQCVGSNSIECSQCNVWVRMYGSVLVSWCAKNRHILTAPEEL